MHFSTRKDDVIIQQLIKGILWKEEKKKLINKGDDLTLTIAIEMPKSFEVNIKNLYEHFKKKIIMLVFVAMIVVVVMMVFVAMIVVVVMMVFVAMIVVVVMIVLVAMIVVVLVVMMVVVALILVVVMMVLVVFFLYSIY